MGYTFLKLFVNNKFITGSFDENLINPPLVSDTKTNYSKLPRSDASVTYKILKKEQES